MSAVLSSAGWDGLSKKTWGETGWSRQMLPKPEAEEGLGEPASGDHMGLQDQDKDPGFCSESPGKPLVGFKQKST